MVKPVFPSTNPCGQLFNDFLNGEPIVKMYVSMGEVISSGKFKIVIKLNDSEDYVRIIHRDGNIRSIEYETASESLINEIVTFLDANFKKETALRKSPIDIYDAHYGPFFISVFRMEEIYHIAIQMV